MKLAPFAIALIFLASCSSEEFSVSSLSLSLERDVNISDVQKSMNKLYISGSFSSPDDNYTFRVVSPDGDLCWEGSFSGPDSEKISEPLEITDNAIFQKGDYSILIYSDNGSELGDSISLNYEESLHLVSDGILSQNAYVIEYDGAGDIISEGNRNRGYVMDGNCVSCEISYKDRFGNDVSISQSFPPSLSDSSL